MDRDIIIAAALVLLVGTGLAALLVVRHSQPVPIPIQVTRQPSPADRAPVTAAPTTIPIAPRLTDAGPTTAPTRGITRRSRSNLPNGGGRQNRRGTATTVIDEPAARQALAQVGSDPAADDVWISAINDSSLTPNARKNLIEDLNETGFENPRNLTAGDLPVIEYRLALIEQLSPQALDDVNAAAFDEAYKDLVNMRQRLVTQ